MIFQSYRKKYNGVPILRKTEIDTIAERCIMDFNPDMLREPMEIDIDSFVQNYLGLRQDFQYLSHSGVYLGMMVFEDTCKVPVYVPEANRVEYISAKAGTVIIDRRLLEKGQEHRYRYTMGHESGHSIFHKGYFSAAILMPRSMVIGLIRCINQFDFKMRNVKYIKMVAGTFNVSWQAAVNRLKSLGMIKTDTPPELS